MTLQNKAMLARLSISQWSARKYDRSASNSVNESFHSNKGVGRVNKLLVPKHIIAPVQRVVVRSRQEFLVSTLPWLDNGMRLLKADSYFPFMEKMSGLKNEFEQTTHRFFLDYAAFIADPEKPKAYMGDLYCETDYPSFDMVKTRFQFKTAFMPVPDTQDWRISAEDQVMTTLERDLEDQLQEAEQTITRDINDRILARVKELHHKLTNDKRFRKESFEGLGILAMLIPQLNVLDDPRIDAIAQDLMDLSKADTDSIRQSSGYRLKVIEKTDAILRKVGGATYGKAA